MINRSESCRATSLQIISSSNFPQCLWIAIQVRLTQDAGLPHALWAMWISWLESNDALAQALENSTS
jgi:hypothetical protein